MSWSRLLENAAENPWSILVGLGCAALVYVVAQVAVKVTPDE